MKKMWIMVILAFAGLMIAQEYNYYEGFNDEITSNPTTDEIISSDPIIVTVITTTNDAPGAETDTTPEMDLVSGAEFQFGKSSKKINVPLWYRWREFSFNATIPYYISRNTSFTFTNWTTMEEETHDYSTSGLGDVSVGVGYGRYLENINSYVDGNITVKLPTGDVEAGETLMEDMGWGEVEMFHPIPLGSGSTDFIFNVAYFYFFNEFTFNGKLLYKLNGEYDYKDEWDMDVKGHQGNQLIINVGANYSWQYRLNFGLDLTYGMNEEGEANDMPAADEMTFIDIRPSVKYPYSVFEFVAGAKIPVQTEVGSDMNFDEDRNPSFFFRTNYRIF